MAPAERRQKATPNFFAKRVRVRIMHAIAHNPTVPLPRNKTNVLVLGCVTLSEIRADGFKRAYVCHHVESRGRTWRACTQTSRTTTFCKQEARMYPRE